MNDLNERINLTFDLDEISRSICKDYQLGAFISNEIIPVGYEDFNYILTTESGKYCVKIFHKERTLENVKNYIDRIKLSSEIGVNSPCAYKCQNELLYVYSKNGVDFKLCVFEYIDGSSFFDLNEIPSDEEIKEIIKQMATLHNAKLNSGFIYDSWTLTNFKEELAKKGKLLNESDYLLIRTIAKEFEKVELDELEYSFVHGDIISSNVLKDKTGKLWIVDYAVSNYLPRIVDIMVTSYNLCTDIGSMENTIEKIRLIVNEYEKYHTLSDYEKEVLPIFYDVGNAMGVLQTNYQKSIGNDNEENEYWYELSKKGIEYSKDEFWGKILK